VEDLDIWLKSGRLCDIQFSEVLKKLYSILEENSNKRYDTSFD
jgi:hypothetical protein